MRPLILLTLASLFSNLRAAEYKAAIASSHTLASNAGIAVLQAGGNAVDAAVATGMALAVVHPSAGNIGGGGFMLVHMHSGETAAFDFRETAPAASTATMYLDAQGNLPPGANHNGHKAVGVPGTVSGFDLALKKFGKKGWSEVSAAAIRLAETGFPLSPAMAKEFADRKDKWLANPAARKVFLRPDASTFSAGEVWAQPQLAETLRRIATQGPDGFYKGITAERIVADMAKNGGLITLEDLTNYKAKQRQPLRSSYHEVEILSMPPPSSGGLVLIEMLHMLEQDTLSSMPKPDYTHLLAETMRQAFRDRARSLGDPDFNPQLPIDTFLSKPRAQELRKKISMAEAGRSEPSQISQPEESPQTTHYCVRDAEGNGVVVTYTLENSYGAEIVAEGLGFLYNNEMGDFNPKPGHTDATGIIGTVPNQIHPGKRMLSSMTPAIVLKDGQPILLVGSPGGRTIINTVFQVILNVLDHHMSLEAAIAAPRIHHQWLPDEIRYETPNPPSAEILESLKTKGHKLKAGPSQGRVTAVQIDPKTGHCKPAVDPRDADAGTAGYFRE